MPKKPELSVQKRSLIVSLQEQGTSQVKIAKIVKCSRHAVQYVLKRFCETGSYLNRPKSGRKRVTNEREDRKLVRES